MSLLIRLDNMRWTLQYTQVFFISSRGFLSTWCVW